MLYRASAVAKAANIPLQRLSSWLDRGVIRMSGDDIDTQSSGIPRQFSRRRLYQIALTSELTRLGIDASAAARAAAVFADESQDGRAAGELFAEGKTVLILDESGARCINIADRSAFEAAMQTVYADTRTVLAVNISTLVARVDVALAAKSRKPMPPAAAVFRNGRQLHT